MPVLGFPAWQRHGAQARAMGGLPVSPSNEPMNHLRTNEGPFLPAHPLVDEHREVVPPRRLRCGSVGVNARRARSRSVAPAAVKHSG
jgi:hypothetical protein